jgi:hypothetical protein
LECGDLSPLWSAATCRSLFWVVFNKGGVETPRKQSGDRSPHSIYPTRYRSPFV